MARRLVEDCRSVDDGREFRWALSLTTFGWMRFISFGVLKSVLLVMIFFGDSPPDRMLAFVAYVVAMIAEAVSAERVVIAAGDDEMVLFDVAFDATPGVPYFRPTSVLQRVGREDVQRTSMGLFGERWEIGTRGVQIASWHRSKIRKWVDEHPYAEVSG
jgi:hypothetical protein